MHNTEQCNFIIYKVTSSWEMQLHFIETKFHCWLDYKQILKFHWYESSIVPIEIIPSITINKTV